jgi:electron transport complex protein RnfE
MGLGFGVALLALGATREIVGHGTLGAGMERLFGDGARELHLVVADGGLLVAVLPPGAFVIAGLLLALVNVFRTGSR